MKASNTYALCIGAIEGDPREYASLLATEYYPGIWTSAHDCNACGTIMFRLSCFLPIRSRISSSIGYTEPLVGQEE